MDAAYRGTDIRAVIDAIPGWRDAHPQVELLTGGLTNRNYAVTLNGLRMFVRIPGADTGLLAVDRANERANTRSAADTGVGARVLHAVPELGVMVLEWIDGTTMSNAALSDLSMPARVASSLRRLHAGPRFLADFDMFRLVDRYLGVVDDRSIPIPAGYREQLGRLPAIERALRAHALPTVPCHNDLLAENYIDDGAAIRIVDYEYSGNNDPCFELGNTCQELGWDEPRQERLCSAYFGDATERLLARMRLNMIMSDMGWTLWAAIQAQISAIDYDFGGWAEERWARAAIKLASDELDRWLRDAAAG